MGTTTTIGYDDKRALAGRIAAVLRAAGWSVKVGDSEGGTDVYVSRRLSSGWQQMGTISIRDDGSRVYNLSRNRAGIRDAVEAAL